MVDHAALRKRSRSGTGSNRLRRAATRWRTVTPNQDNHMADEQPKKKSALDAKITPDAALGAVVGTEPITRGEVAKRLWDYIKANGLQDPADKRTIIADDKLRPIFDGKDRVSMFEMTKLANGHMIK
jgi:chromatin remodeling complex protein RSC6